MKSIVGVLVALVALVGVTAALNPQPEPPAQILNELGQVTVQDGILVIDIGTFPDAETANQNVLGTMDVLAHTPVTQDTVVIIADSTAYTYERIKKTDHLGTYHFKASKSILRVEQSTPRTAFHKHIMPSYNAGI